MSSPRADLDTSRLAIREVVELRSRSALQPIDDPFAVRGEGHRVGKGPAGDLVGLRRQIASAVRIASTVGSDSSRTRASGLDGKGPVRRDARRRPHMRRSNLPAHRPRHSRSRRQAGATRPASVLARRYLPAPVGPTRSHVSFGRSLQVMGSQRDALHVKGNAGQSDRGQWITGTVVRERGNASADGLRKARSSGPRRARGHRSRCRARPGPGHHGGSGPRSRSAHQGCRRGSSSPARRPE